MGYGVDEILGQFNQHMFTQNFYERRIQKRKMTDDLIVFFTYLGSTRPKDACRTLMKMTPGQLICGKSIFYHSIKLSMYFCDNKKEF